MNVQLFYKYLNREIPVNTQEISELEILVAQKPWFATARVLLLKALKNENHRDYQNACGITALYVPDRKRLYEFLQTTVQTAVTVQIEQNQEDMQPDGYDLTFAFNKEYFSQSDFLLETENLPQTNDDLIANFIKNNPKIIPSEKNNSKEINLHNPVETNDIASEILAEIYESQGLYKQAIECYNKLILYNPEKSIYFAGKINDIKVKKLN